MITVSSIKAFSDNYVWLLSRSGDNRATIVDPGDSQPVLRSLQRKGLSLETILITHHHWDHTGGIPGLVSHPDMPIYGPHSSKISHINKHLSESDTVKIKHLGLTLKILEIPGHTIDHIAYYGSDMLFCGDTLFAAGCGRLFEGTHTQMVDSLNTLASLPDHTQVYCAHEYTANNLAFALTIEPDNQDIKQRIEQVKEKRRQGLPTLPTTIGLEKKTNPFLRCREDAVLDTVKKMNSGVDIANPIEVFACLREAKDRF